MINGRFWDYLTTGILIGIMVGFGVMVWYQHSASYCGTHSDYTCLADTTYSPLPPTYLFYVAPSALLVLLGVYLTIIMEENNE
jgi:hypothetical protein